MEKGEEVIFKILSIIEFTSERKRMSVVVQSEDGSIRMFCKGADNVMMSKIADDVDIDLKNSTLESLHKFSVKVISFVTKLLFLQKN